MFVGNWLIISELAIVVIINLISTSLNPVNSIRVRRPHLAPPTPQIWLSEYSEQDSFEAVPAEREFRTLNGFQNQIISKNGSDYVIEDALELVVFTCQAKYPVQWTLPHSEQLLGYPHYQIESISVRLSEFPPGLEQPSNKYFKTFLQLRYLYRGFLSVTFTCTASEYNSNGKGSPQSNLHIYATSDRKVLDREGETISITHDPNSRSKVGLLLPCRPSRPDTPITLEKKVGDDWTPILTESTPSLSFDPKVGFTLKRFFWGKKSLGLYRCTVNGSDVGRDEDAVVLVNVTSGTGSTTSLPKFESHLWKAKGATASLTPPDNHLLEAELTCCFGVASEDNGVPNNSVISESCLDHLQCEILRATFLTKMKENDGIYGYRLDNPVNCSNVLLFQTPSLVLCRGENLDYAAEFQRVLIPGVTSLKNRTAYLEGNGSLETNDTSKYHILTIVEDMTKEVPLDQKILISMGRVTAKDYSYGAIFWKKDFSQSDLINGHIDREWEVVSEYNRNFYYEGEPLRVMCFGLRHFYSEGAQLRLNWKNGSRSNLEKAILTREVKFFGRSMLDGLGDGMHFISAFGKEINASMDMESVDCFMPVWNSSKWDKLTYKISTVAYIPPTFVGGEEEEAVYFHVNETEKEISWEVMEGEPMSEITVTKDGKELTSSLYNSSSSNDTTIITIKFELVAYESHGSYECTATNGKNRIMKTIKVIIAGKSSAAAMYISLICVSVLPLLLIGIVVKYRLQLRLIKLRRA